MGKYKYSLDNPNSYHLSIIDGSRKINFTGHGQYYVTRAGENVPAALVLAGPVFLKIKINFQFYKKQVINKSASVSFGRLIILNYNR